MIFHVQQSFSSLSFFELVSPLKGVSTHCLPGEGNFEQFEHDFSLIFAPDVGADNIS